MTSNFPLHTYQALLAAREHAPFAVLGLQTIASETCWIIYRPSAERLSTRIQDHDVPFQRIEGTDLFVCCHRELGKASFTVNEQTKAGEQRDFQDPYRHQVTELAPHDRYRLGSAECLDAHQFMGAVVCRQAQQAGVRFTVWAPNAERVSVVGDFNDWDGRVYPLQSQGESGLWSLFVPGVMPGALYKYEIRHRVTGHLSLKADPYARQAELRPGTASRVIDPAPYVWQDAGWLAQREAADWLHAPCAIYEVHAGSWRRHADGRFLNYRELAHDLVDYVRELGFTHIQLMPITEHPFDGSWGYQVTGYFAPTSRYGSAEDLRYFIDHCHQHGIGVLLDWVPAHFPKDACGLARFDGTALYEHEDPLLGEHQDWGTLIFNFGRHEVRNFLLSSAAYWIREFHIDGLRVDAVASMLYLDYSREAGQWRPNRYGSNENLEAIAFLRQLNEVVHREFPGAVVIAEESTAWPQVSRPVYLGGLGFSMKWNMGWMNDTLAYFKQDPVYRKYHHERLTFGLLYAFSENFVLPLSHDEVVHGKGSILGKMPGDPWQQFANVRLLYLYQYTHPGKKLLFMGNEFAQGREWSHEGELEWSVLEHGYQAGVKQLVGDLNRLYRQESALHQGDFQPNGFYWIDCHDHEQSVISYARCAGNHTVIVVLNFTPVPRACYRIGVPEAGTYAEILNTDSCYYAGSNLSNGTHIETDPIATMGQPCSVALTLPPLGGLILRRDG